VNILKHVGEHAGHNIDAIFGFERGQTGDLPGGFERLFDGYMVATDPDGYGVEFFEGS